MSAHRLNAATDNTGSPPPLTIRLVRAGPELARRKLALLPQLRTSLRLPFFVAAPRGQPPSANASTTANARATTTDPSPPSLAANCRPARAISLTSSPRPNGSSPPGCTSTDCATITVIPSTLTANAGRDTTYCSNSAACILIGGITNGNPTANGGTPPYTYQWGPGVVQAVQNPCVSPTATTTYCVTVVDFAGCSASSCMTLNLRSCYCGPMPVRILSFARVHV